MASITFEQVAVSADRSLLVRDIDLHIGDGEVVAIIGPSGSGKTTLLRAIAGLSRISHGRLVIGGEDVTERRSGDRDVAMVFQEPTLLPRRTGRRNVSFPLELRREAVESIRMRVGAEARALHIEHLLDKWPETMSRGEAQLVQMARALVRVPNVLLLDEPFAVLDEPRRRSLRAEFQLLQAGYGVTTVLATNDPDDAMRLAHRVVALEPGPPGRLAQVGDPTTLHDEPASVDIAAALGDLWRISVRVRAESEGAWLVGVKDPTFRVRTWAPAVVARDGHEVVLGLRSSAILPSTTGAHTASVERVIPGSEPRLVLDLAGHVVVSSHEHRATAGDTVRVDLDHPFVFATDGRRLA